ncbi:MAG: hypothetical protein IJW63_05460 [Lachnospiraceae bacterium]|nr:hypothetical protein [Lachnospiraceae bacterium]
MNITFFIGNGFDINLGLKTRYENFYPFFISNAQENNMIRNWIDGNESLWADLEEKLGQELVRLSQDRLEQFYSDKEELDKLLLEYLEKEQEKYCFEDRDKLKKEFTRSMETFFVGLPAKDIASINATLDKYKNEEYVYAFITFNYTNVLDKFIELYGTTRVIAGHPGNSVQKGNRLGNVIHIHGTTNEEMILGVNDETQVQNDVLKQDEVFLDTFIKKRMNNGIGQRKTERALDLISKSHIICIFGMSIGNTDKMWWEELIKWLVSNENNKIIIFWKGYEDALRRKLPSAVIRLNEKIKRNFFEKGKGQYEESLYSEIKDRIMISYNSNIFSLSRVEEEEK